MVGSISGWVIVTRAVTYGKWEIRAIDRTSVPYAPRGESERPSGAILPFLVRRTRNKQGPKTASTAYSRGIAIFSASQLGSPPCASTRRLRPRHDIHLY